MKKALSDFIETIGIRIFKTTNRKKTDEATFLSCSHLDYHQIRSFYDRYPLFESCREYNPPVLIRSESRRTVETGMYGMDSMFQPIPEFREAYDSLPENKRIYFEEFRSPGTDTRKKTCAIYLHGFSEKSYAPEKMLLFNRLIAQTPGMEVLAVQLPYHMKRSPKKQPYSGAYVLDSYPVVTIESFRQAVHDVSQVLSYAKEKYNKVIVAGFSLGGFVTSFLGTCDDRADLYILEQAGARIPKTLRDLSICPGLSDKKESWIKQGIDFENLYQPIELLNFKPVVPPEKVISIAGIFDKVVDFKDAEELRRFYKSGYNIDYPAGHKGILFEIKKIKEAIIGIMDRFAAEEELDAEKASVH